MDVRQAAQLRARGLLSFNNKPLRIALYPGMLLLSVAFTYAVW